MKALKQIINVLYLVIFLYPVFFQSIHIVNSHGEDTYKYQIGAEHNNFSEDSFKGYSCFVNGHTDNDCDVCDYEFSIQTPASVTQLHFGSFSHQSIYLFAYQNRITSVFTSKIHSRGPPVLS